MNQTIASVVNMTATILVLLLILSACGESKEKLPVESADAPESKSTQKQQEGEELASANQDEKTPTIRDVDYSSYFNGLHGSAVFYSPTENSFDIYNLELAQERRSPCSSFKIIATTVGLESGVIARENSTRKWSGERFWNASWNRDIDCKAAFETSCVWYFRGVIDDIAKDDMQNSLQDLSYGNADISDWEGYLNGNRKKADLSGFWIESSLKISPKEQTEVLARIFETGSSYNKENLDFLKTVMLVEQDQSDSSIYGKTGTGKLGNRLLDAWFVGFFTKNDVNTYFAIYLGETDRADASSALAKEMAIQIIANCY